MRLFERRASLPIGVDIRPDSVSLVVCDASAGGFVVRETRTRDVPSGRDGDVDRTLAETIRAAASDLNARERRCILSAPPSDVVVKAFRTPPGMRRRESERAAALEADTLVDWPASERLVALDPLPGKSGELLLSIARTSSVERLVAIARAGGLRPVAVDVPACAWRRAIPDTDAVLDCSRDRAELVVFGDPVGVTHAFPPRLIDERLAAHVRSAFVEARRDGIGDVQRLTVFATPLRFESMEDLLRGDGYAVAPVRLGGVEAPPWTFAYGLASWSVAPRGLYAA